MSDIVMPSSVPSPLGITHQQEMQEILQRGWRLTPATMADKIFDGRWIPAKHFLYISTIVATAIAKGNARIILTMPPRHGKSEFLSVNTPIWFLEWYPNKYVMSVSYGLDLATDFSLKVRTAFLNEELHHLLSTRLRRDKLKIDRFLTTENGGLTAAGIGGPITGRGADLLLIDDYVKNAEAALSDPQKKASWEWLKAVAWTRLEPGASVIILATRWAQDDLIGRVQEEMAHENWIVINLPAIARPNDPLGRAVGEALWPERYDEKALALIKLTLGSYWWNAMYQQDPPASMSGAELGDMIHVVSSDSIPHTQKLKKVRPWDLAATEGDGDWTAGPLMAVEDGTNDIYILDMQRFRKSPGGVELMIATTADGDGYGVPIWMEQEPGSAGVAVIKTYEEEVLHGFAFKGEKSTGKIEIRAQPFLAAVEAGRVYMVRAGWNKKLVDEINAFPDGEHDDQVSALALGYHKLVRGRGGVTWGRKAVRRATPTHVHELEETQERISGLTWGR